jgi:hypothetical protein
MVVLTRFGEYSEEFAKFIRPTKLADFDYGPVKKVANELVREAKTDYQAIHACWEYVASLPTGFDLETSKASKILRAQRGMCNTKTTLFVALLRCAGVPCQVHAWRVHKVVHKEHMPGIIYSFTPKKTLFTYPEVYYKEKWMLLSEALYGRAKTEWESCPFDDAKNRSHPLKKEWIAEDLGTYWHPDTVYERFGTNTQGWRRAAFPLAKVFLNTNNKQKRKP